MKVWVGIVVSKKTFNEIFKIEKSIAEKYKTYYNFKGKIGPHITITHQENINKKDFNQIEKIVSEISKKTKPFKIKIKCVRRFYKPIVIYMNVLKSTKLNKLNKELSNNLRKFGKVRRYRKYTPHVTIANKDITKENFKKAFKELKNKKLSYEFNVNKLYLGKSKPTERMRVFKSFKLKA